MVNDWSAKEAHRAETTWGDEYPVWLRDMYEFVTRGTFLVDLGCGFGRFASWLKENGKSKAEQVYTGYDSSEAMLERFRSRIDPEMVGFLDEYHAELCDIEMAAEHKVKPHHNVLIGAVMIHLKISTQNNILESLAKHRPERIAFDINSPSEDWIRKAMSLRKIPNFEKHITLTEGKFRMMWQSHYEMTGRLLELFPGYLLTTGYFDLKHPPNRRKVTYLLERADAR